MRSRSVLHDLLACTCKEDAAAFIHQVRFDWVMRLLAGTNFEMVLRGMCVDLDLSGPVEALHLLRAGLQKPPVCKVCGDRVHFLNGWPTYCSRAHSWKDPQTLSRRKRTLFDRYGDENYFNHERFKQTSIERYGTEYPMQSEKILESRARSNIEKYGVPTVLAEKSSIREQITEQIPYIKIQAFLDGLRKVRPLFTIKEYIVSSVRKTKYPFECLTCGHLFKKRIHYAEFGCQKCYPKYQSTQERLIISWLEEVKIKNIVPLCKRVIPPQEIDIWLPDFKFGIEVNGLWWHSTQAGVSQNYHLKKTNRIEQLGFVLLHFFENEIAENPTIVKSMIFEKCGKNEFLDAAELHVQEIDHEVGNQFLKRTHLQSSCDGDIYLGLFKNSTLVCVSAYKKLTENVIELLRFSCELGISVPDGFSKLQAAFEKYHSKKIRYIFHEDRRWPLEKQYFSDWKLVSTNEPGCWHFNDGALEVFDCGTANYEKFQPEIKL